MIRPVGFLENVWSLSVSLANKQRRDEIRKADGRLVVRSGKWQHEGITENGTWRPLRTAIHKANRLVVENFPAWEIAEVALEEMPAGTHPTTWREGGDEIEVHAAIVTNPRARLFSEAGAVHVPVGDIVMYDPQGWRAAMNEGTTPRLHLIIVLRKREIEE